MVLSMGYRIWTGTKDADERKVYLPFCDEKIDKDHLVFLLSTFVKGLSKKTRENHWHLSLEIDGKPARDKEIDRYLDMCNITEEELEAERIKRLKLLHLEKSILADAIQNKTIWVSEQGKNYTLSGYIYEAEVRKAMEKVSLFGEVPSFSIVTISDNSIQVSILYVSLHKGCWNHEIPDTDGFLICGVYNSNYDELDWDLIQIQWDSSGNVKRVM